MNPGNKQLLNPNGRLQPGCYYMRFTPIEPYWDDDDNPNERADRERGVLDYEGTLRVVHYDQGGGEAFTVKQLEDGKRGEVLFISGDLYAAPPSGPQYIHREVPIFRRADYRFYLLANDLQKNGYNQFSLSLESYELVNNEWKPTTVVARLEWSEPPDWGPASDYLIGSVEDKAGNKIGEMTLYWVSFYLRRAVLEFDRVDNVTPPFNSLDGVASGGLNDEAQHTWASVFEKCGWRMDTKESDQPAEPASKIWTDAELHQAMPSLRDTFDLDEEWRYHIFCVGKLDDGGRGYKFDISGGESGSPLFESIVLAAKYEFLDEDIWGNGLAGRTLDATPAYFRTAVHELGHALKLDHNFSTNGFMSTTDTIRDAAANMTPGDGQINVLDAIEWRFAPDDLQRLRHWPDLIVRPGGENVPRFKLPGIDEFRMVVLQGGSSNGQRPIPLEFEIKAFEESIPLGAPARILLTLTNKGSIPLNVPRLRFKSGNVTGSVELPSGETRQFAPLAETIDELGVEELEGNKSIKGSLTLLRGPDGALFPHSGTYKVTVDIWLYRDRQFSLLRNSTTIRVGLFVDEKHRRIADLLRRSKGTLVSFAIGGGEGLEEANQAVNLALNNPILRPHFAILRLKRFCRGIGRVRGSLDEALRLLGEDPKLTPSELEGLVAIVRPPRALSLGEDRSDAKALRERVLLNNYLRADLRHVGTRILLGNLQDATVRAFLNFLRTNRAPVASNGAPKRASDILRDFMEVNIGLTRAASNELMELLLGYDTCFAEAVRAYAIDPTDPNGEKVADAARKIGISFDILEKVVQRLRDVAKSCPSLLREDEVDKAGELIVEAFSETKPGGLYDIFVNNLKHILTRAGIYPAESVQPPATALNPSTPPPTPVDQMRTVVPTRPETKRRSSQTRRKRNYSF